MAYILEPDKRGMTDRRKKPTPGLSRYTLRGRRKEFRRKNEQTKGGYIDQYSPALFFVVVFITGLSLLDSIFTMMILDKNGLELNPVVQSVMQIYGDKFWIWKYAVVSCSLVLLTLHSKFKMVKAVFVGVTSIYLLVVIHEINMILHH